MAAVFVPSVVSVAVIVTEPVACIVAEPPQLPATSAGVAVGAKVTSGSLEVIDSESVTVFTRLQ